MKTKNEKRKTKKYSLEFKTFLICFNLAVCALVVQFAIESLDFNQARADGISLSVSTSLIKVHLTAAEETSKPITIENRGGQSLEIKVLLKPFAPSGDNGQIRYLSDNEISREYKQTLKGIFVTDGGIVTDNFELGPKQKKDLKLNFAIPRGARAADYYFSVVFLASDTESAEGFASQNRIISDDALLSVKEKGDYKNYSVLNAGIATNVLLSMGNLDVKGEIEDFSAPSFVQAGPVEFKLRIKNSGHTVIFPRGVIFIRNMFGQTVGRLDLEPANILSDSSRNLELPNGEIIWPEKFLLGPYTAEVNLVVSEKEGVISKTIYFLAVPAQFTIIFVIMIIILVGVIFRIRYRLKRDK